MEDTNEQLLFSIIEYLESLKGASVVKDADALTDALNSLKVASGIDVNQDRQRLALVSKSGAPVSLESLFQVAASSMGPAAAPKAAEPSMEDVEVTKVPQELQEKFRAYLDKLKGTIYFKDIEPDTPAWQKRLVKAREKFMRKYGAGEEPQQQPAPNPQEAEARKNAGNERLKAGDYTGAEQLYSEAIALDPNNAVFFSNRCAARQYLNRHEDALQDARESGRLNPSFAKAFMRAGHSLVALGRPQEAIEEFERALALNADDAAAKEAIESARAQVQAAPPPAAGGAPAFLNNPAMQRMAQQMQGGGGPPDLASMMQNPELIQAAMQAMQDPQMAAMMQQMTSDPAMMSNLMNTMGGGGGGAPPPGGDQ